jgi:hypothetical protein
MSHVSCSTVSRSFPCVCAPSMARYEGIHHRSLPTYECRSWASSVINRVLTWSTDCYHSVRNSEYRDRSLNNTLPDLPPCAPMVASQTYGVQTPGRGAD